MLSFSLPFVWLLAVSIFGRLFAFFGSRQGGNLGSQFDPQINDLEPKKLWIQFCPSTSHLHILRICISPTNGKMSQIFFGQPKKCRKSLYTKQTEPTTKRISFVFFPGINVIIFTLFYRRIYWIDSSLAGTKNMCFFANKKYVCQSETDKVQIFSRFSRKMPVFSSEFSTSRFSNNP